MKYKITTTNKYEKQLKKIAKQGKKIIKLIEVVDKLANGENLEAKYKNHKLIGNHQNYYECHIEPDWLLIYKIEEYKLILELTQTGSHSDLF